MPNFNRHKILAPHKKVVNNMPDSAKSNLSNADVSKVSWSRADLSKVDLHGALQEEEQNNEPN